MPDTHKKLLKIKNIRGLHARASAKFVKCAEQFDAEIQVQKDNYCVEGTSLMDLMMLGASKDSEIKVITKGNEAQKALRAIEELIENKFNENE